MKLGIMQPYVFPYIGYFQLVRAVDELVFYDDVNYIKNGWINRNRILLNGTDHYITLPCTKASPNRLIREIEINRRNSDENKLLKTIYLAYKKAPFFDHIFPLIEGLWQMEMKKISNFAQQSIIQFAKYLEINTEFKSSSESFPETKGMEKADRIIAICKKEQAENYLNVEGGKALYNKKYFMDKGISLHYIKPLPVVYKQFNNKFVPWLSIIDLLMFNDKEKVQVMLDQYELD
jgi:hypothetical protein